ncbi:MAG TPA: HlyD family secretion protein [Bryobacteraceae bacterium]|nr:HlyD family secretion protein [Bryobacteraceae bacterium]
MPEDEDRGRNSVHDDLIALLQQHRQLRSDVDRLRQERQQLLEEKQKQNGKNGGGEKKPDQKAEEGKKEEKKEEKKPPLPERTRTWIREHPLAFALIATGTVVLAIGAFFYWRYLNSYVSTDDAEIDGHTHQISSRISGTVTAVNVEDNRTVSQGQVLVELDTRDYETALSQAQANLAQAVAALEAQSPNVPITQTSEATNVATARLEVANAESALQAARQSYQSGLAELEQARANAENAATEEVRYRGLAEKEEVSREMYDQRATQARSSAAVVAAKQAAADAAEKAVAQREAALAQAQDRFREAESNRPRQMEVQHASVAGRRANIEAAKAQVEQARLNLTYCKIIAPATGIVGSKTVEVGQQVAPGQELFAITTTDDIWVTANFKETQIASMHPGQSVTVHVDALDLDFEGMVESLPGATGAKYSLLPPENATGNYVKVVQRLPVRIRLKPGQQNTDRLRPGMSAEPKVWVK